LCLHSKGLEGLFNVFDATEMRIWLLRVKTENNCYYISQVNKVWSNIHYLHFFFWGKGADEPNLVWKSLMLLKNKSWGNSQKGVINAGFKSELLENFGWNHDTYSIREFVLHKSHHLFSLKTGPQQLLQIFEIRTLRLRPNFGHWIFICRW
jgi:hypothetical protein